jgi:glycerophosphoryl diester phosphodiesterase
MARRRHRRPHRARNRAAGVLALVTALFAAAGGVETAHAAIAPATPFGGFPATGVVPLVSGHSHNDYRQRHPLADALSRGYTSIEADVVLVGGQLLVGHDLLQALARGATLRALYLDPLADWVARNGGAAFAPGGPGLTLLIDVKSEPRSSWRALENVLSGYADMLTRFTPEGVAPGAVTVVVSGNRARDLVAADANRFTALDGRVADLEAAHPLSLTRMPMISERWPEIFPWPATQHIADAGLARMRRVVAEAHAQGRRIRFYDTPDGTAAIRENVWRTELAAGVDLLNIDDLAEGQAFLLAHRSDQVQARPSTAPDVRARAPRRH